MYRSNGSMFILTQAFLPRLSSPLTCVGPASIENKLRIRLIQLSFLGKFENQGCAANSFTRIREVPPHSRTLSELFSDSIFSHRIFFFMAPDLSLSSDPLLRMRPPIKSIPVAPSPSPYVPPTAQHTPSFFLVSIFSPTTPNIPFRDIGGGLPRALVHTDLVLFPPTPKISLSVLFMVSPPLPPHFFHCTPRLCPPPKTHLKIAFVRKTNIFPPRI